MQGYDARLHAVVGAKGVLLGSPAKYLGTLRARWRALLTLAVIGTSLGILGGRLSATEYTADRLLVVSSMGGQSLADLVQGGDLAASRAQSLAYVGSTAPTLIESLTRAGIDLSIANGFLITTRVPPDTTYLEIQAKGPTSESTLRLAAAAAAQLIEANGNWSSTTTTRPNARIDVYDITPLGLQQAATPTRPPRWLAPIVGGALLPLLGYFVIISRHAFNPTVGHSMNLGEILPFPVVGLLPVDRQKHDENSPPAPEYSMVAARYGLMPNAAQGRIVLFAAVIGPSDAWLVLTLARALTNMGRTVIMVDADLRHPGMVAKTRGDLATLLESGGDATTAIDPWGDPPVYVLPTSERADSSRLLLSHEAEKTFQQLREAGDFIFVSGAPALSGPDFAAVADLSDEVLLIADPGTSVDRVLAAAGTVSQGTVAGLLVRSPRLRGWIASRRLVRPTLQGNGGGISLG